MNRSWGRMAGAVALSTLTAQTSLGAGEEDAPIPTRDRRVAALHWKGAVAPVASLPTADWSPHFLKGGQSWEAWSWEARFPDGWVLLSEFQITNLGSGDHRGLAVGLVLGPDGRSTLIKNGRKREQWDLEQGPEGFTVNIARHRLEVAPGASRLSMRNSQGALELAGTSSAPLLRPGKIDLPDGKCYEMTVLAPRFAVHGQATLPGADPIALKEGRATASYIRSTVADYKLGVSFLRFSTFDPDLELTLHDITAAEKQGYARVPWLFVAGAEGGTFETQNVKRTWSALEKDSQGPRYPVPKGFDIDVSEAGRRIRGHVELEQVYRYDLVEGIDSPIARFIVKQVAHPVRYFFRARYRLEVDRGSGPTTHTGTGFASLAITRDPPRDRPW